MHAAHVDQTLRTHQDHMTPALRQLETEAAAQATPSTSAARGQYTEIRRGQYTEVKHMNLLWFCPEAPCLHKLMSKCKLI